MTWHILSVEAIKNIPTRILPWGIGLLLLLGLGALMPLQPLAQATDPDLNNDGTVTGQDVAIVARCLGNNAQNTPNCQFAIADTDGDGDVDQDDLQYVVDHLGETGFPTGGNVAPIAEAGPNQTVSLGETVSLDGSTSTDADGDPLTYLWAFTSLPSGSTATLSDPTAVNPTFVADLAGTYVLQLVVNDGTIDSAPDTVTIATTNSQPVAEAGPDQSVQVTDLVQLDGSGSSDVDGDQLTFLWELSAKPAGSTATLSDPTVVNPTFVVDVPGTYIVLLTVNDGTLDSEVDFTTITTVNSAPVADAGPDETVFVTQSAFLDGTNSSDVDNDPLTFAWSFNSIPAGSTATLSDPTSPTPDFTVDLPGTYIVQLVVNDGTVDSVADTVVINTQNSAPVADAGPNQAVGNNQTVQLDGSQSSDVDGDPLTYQWALTTKPEGSSAVLSNAQAESPTFVADLIGTYLVQLIVNDGSEDSAPSTVTITANTLPVADAGPDQTVLAGSLVTLDGTGSSDPDGHSLTYQWTLTTQPAGSTATLSDPTVAHPTFVADAAGSYTVTLVVNDGHQDSVADTVTITATSNDPPVAHAGPDQRTIAGATVVLNGAGSTDPEQAPLQYQWTFLQRPTGSTATLVDSPTVSPVFVPDVNGTYEVQLVVNDGAISSAPDTVTVTVGNTPPILDPIGNHSFPLGQTLSFALTGSDPDGDATTFSVTPVILPAHMVFNQATNLVTFHPDASQVGDHVLTFGISDAFTTTTETVTITVQAPAPGGLTGLSGRILDTNDFVNGGIETPVVGATVSLLNLNPPVSTTSDAQGNFLLSNVPAGVQVLDMDASTAQAGPGGATYASFRERIDLLANTTTVIDRPFFLPRNDPNSQMTVNGLPVTGVDPNETTIVTNPTLSATLTIPPHTAMLNGVEYTGAITITEVLDGLAPAALPSTLDPELLITIQPPGVTFTQGLALTLANREGLTSGNDMKLWSLDPNAGAFEVVGVGRIVGSVINTISGGVRAADWHMFSGPGIGGGGAGGSNNGPGPQGPNQDDDNPERCENNDNSEITLCTGHLKERHSLAFYRSQGVTRALQLVYASDTANPQVIIEEPAEISVRSAVPERVSMALRVGVPRLKIFRGIVSPTAPSSRPAGLEVGSPIFTDTSGLAENIDVPFRPKFAWPVPNLTTGSYPVRVTLTSHFPGSSVGTQMYETITIHNQQTSPFGAGWSLAGVNRLHVQDNGDVVMAKGGGGVQLYRKLNPGLLFPEQIIPLNGIGFNPQKVAIADFTNDGILDLGIPTTSGVPGVLEVHEGLGNGQFQLAAVSSVGTQMAHVEAADFDEDGILDVVTQSTYAGGSVTVAYGDGTGAMIAPVTVPTGSSPSRVATGDFNNDGHQDVAVAIRLSNRIDIHLGTGIRGAGGFGAAIPSVTLNGSPQDLVAADLDQDGNIDLVTANNSTVSVVYGDGTGAFPTLLPLSGVQFALTVAAADLNNDGFPDLATTSNGGGVQNDQVSVFESNGAGGFWDAQHILFPTGFLPSNINLGDMTGDGIPDLVVETQGNGFGLGVVEGDGFGGFGGPQVTTVGKKPLALNIADLDSNGTLDVVLSIQGVGIGNDHVQIFRNPVPGPVDSYLIPPGEFSTLTQNPDTSYTQTLKTGTVIQFDPTGKQTAVTDRNDNTTAYAYDAQGRLETITDPVGLTTTLAYSGALLSSITDHVGRQTQFQHDGQGNLTTITDPDLTTRTFTYDARHQLTSQVNKRGFRTQYVFNDFGQVVGTVRADDSTNDFTPAASLGVVAADGTQGTESNPLPIVLEEDALATVVDGNGHATTTAFDVFGAATQVIDALGRTTSTVRNDAGQPISIITPNGAEEKRTYDAQGNLLTRREAYFVSGQDRTTSFEYDPVFNLVTKITDPANKVTTIVRDPANGNPLEVINPLLDTRVRTFNSQGLVLTDLDERNLAPTTFTYDAKGNLETILDAEGHTTRFVRDAAGNVTSLIEGEGTPEQRTRTLTYDTMNRLETATDGTANPPTQFAYDDQGNLTTTTLPTNEQEVRTYDARDRVASIDDPLRGLTAFAYDGNGNLTRTVNAAGDPTIFAYDVENQLETITDALGGVQIFSYDLEGNVETFTDARQKVTTFLYDKLNRQTDRISHGGTFTTTFTYDKRDNLIDTTDPKTQLIHRVYDDLSRLTDIQTPDNTITIGYDQVGNPTEVTDTDSQVTFTYDGLNRVETAETSQTSGLQPQVLLTSVYNAVGNRTALDEDTSTSVTNYVYDLAGRLITLTPPAGASTQVTLGYDPSGRLASLVYPNGVTTAYGYDNKGRLDSLSHTLGANPSFVSFGYTYNPVGNILDILDQVTPSENRTHTYDALQRLKTGGAVANAETYDYDLVGNRTTSFLSSSHTHDDLNRLLEDDQFTYTYDNNGNLATKTDKNTSDLTTYQWDAQDQLIQIDRPDSTTVTYKYDGLGRRIEKNVAGAVTRYVYDGEDILLEYDGTNTFVARYSHGDQVDQPLVLQKAGAGFFYYHGNHQGSITHLTDSVGTIANSYVYDSYGRQLTVAEAVSQPFSYTGREYDAESGLYFYRARYFDANTGRFLSEDPIRRLGGLNLYQYARQNPVRYGDPRGLTTSIITTYDYGIGTHSAIHVENGGSGGGEFLYDPAGSYIPPSGTRGTGDFFEGADANLDNYIQDHQSRGSTVEVTELPTTPEQEAEIARRAEELGGQSPGFCTLGASGALGGSCDIPQSFFPSSLANDARQAKCGKSQ